ncbi:MAG TPA: aminotransferase class I/II-fold pyridoxal phosphate-dependent enzyme, partial [Salinimicrobium sp.]|nr:aminotransferase class I/II-fold pyridoxal phosphate-dependent enzyme [Salinimicrobium sp.]
MAKIKQNNFLDTVDEVFTNAKEAGVIHLHAEGGRFSGRKIEIGGKEHFHFGTTGYLGLEQDRRLKDAAIDAIEKFGTQFPLSKSYISHPLYNSLEEKIHQMYGSPIIITKNSTLGHIAVIPTAVQDEDGVILDHQVHWSVQNATQFLKVRGVPVEMIRHNNLEMLEDRIKKMRGKCRKIWYMADGIYSMYGDFAPINELVSLCNKYPQLHLYIDDVHGMSWKGKNGTGYIMDVLGQLPDNMLLFGTLSKTFGASGAVVICSEKKLHSKIKNFGGPLTFSAQLEPASVAAASASADIHLSPEIYQLQDELRSRILYFNQLLEKTDLPLVEKNESPVFYIGTGMPISGYNFVQRLMKEGFYVNLGLFPAVPVKNTGIRITISRHNQIEEIKSLVDAMVYHYPRALEETNSNLIRVRKAFRMPVEEKKKKISHNSDLKVEHHSSIQQIDKALWNEIFGERGAMDWEGQAFLEKVFNNQEKPENNWEFHYIIIYDQNSRPVLATLFCLSLWKDDLLAPASISLQMEEKRKQNPYYLTSKVLSMGSLFTEGEHLFFESSHPMAGHALELLIEKVEELD